MHISIDLKSRVPLYEQVVRGVSREIVGGMIAVDQKIPSVRDTARTLGINPNTVQKAYRILEERGYFYTAQGQGTFAAAPPPAELARETGVLYAQLRECVQKLRFYGESPAAIRDYLQTIEEARE